MPKLSEATLLKKLETARGKVAEFEKKGKPAEVRSSRKILKRVERKIASMRHAAKTATRSQKKAEEKKDD